MLDVKKVISKISLFILAMFVFIGFCFQNNAFSWNDEVTHKLLAEYASKSSVLDEFRGGYLRNTLGFDNGLYHELTLNTKKDSVIEWIKLGAELEDEGNIWNIVFGNARFDNHFHNPLKPWSEAGLADIKTGESSLLWAQDGAYQQTFDEGDQSWQKIRDYYYLALTSATDAERQANLARTFQGLGHQMHLIQDAAQPDHVRNDAHPADSILKRNNFGSLYFETWAKKEFKSLEDLQAFAPDSIMILI